MARDKAVGMEKTAKKKYRKLLTVAEMLFSLLTIPLGLGIAHRLEMGTEEEEGLVLSLAFLFLAGFQYVFPVQARMDLPLKGVLKTAWFLSAAAFPCTLGALAVIALAMFLSLFAGPSSIHMAVFLWAVIGFGLTAYLQSFLFRLAFRRLKRIHGETEPEELPDPWETENGEDSKDET